jgi:hypothetical protein
MYHLAQHVGSTMDQLSLDQIRTELQKMVGLSQRIMQMVNFRDDEGYLLPPPPLLLQQLCLHLCFVPGTDTSTARAHCVRFVLGAVECFLRHRYMTGQYTFFVASYII